MKLSSIFSAILAAGASVALASAIRRHPTGIVTLDDDISKRELLQDVVTWDEHSIFIHGERIMIFSAEMHPFRLPVPSLWLDVMQKVRALGFNALSFYVDWALLEGKEGDIHDPEVLDLRPFFDAATEAGIWLIARPGPYINAEVSGGGYPGWLQRLNGTLRSNDEAYMDATNNYASYINGLIADAQVTNGGPVILYQPENEYFYRKSRTDPTPPDQEYIAKVIKQVRDAGIIIPLHSNDGDEADISRVLHPGPGEVDMLGYDAYPLGFDCSDTTTWSHNVIPWDIQRWHELHAPGTPLSSPEFQGGAFTGWGGAGPWKCNDKFDQEFVRVFYKDLYSLGFSIISLYMTYGGTNWGNLGMPSGPTTYDYGAAIGEDRAVNREKYSELKLEAQLLKVAPGYLTTEVDNSGSDYTSSSGVSVVARLNNKTEDGHFFVARQTQYWSTSSVNYTLTLPTSAGNISIPQLGGELSLHGRDSKMHVTDFKVADNNVLYSTAEILTWKSYEDGDILVVYGGDNELHELAIKGAKDSAKVRAGSRIGTKENDEYVVIQFTPSTERGVVQIGSLTILLLDRNSAYKYWVTDLPGDGKTFPKSYGTGLINPESLIINGPYLSRSAKISRDRVVINADFNSTMDSLEVFGAPKSVRKLIVNGKEQDFVKSDIGSWVVDKIPDVPTEAPKLPDLGSLDWKMIDTLPELSPDYDTSKWTPADLEKTYNTWSAVEQKTPTSLFGSDYGYNTGALLFHGDFKATGQECQLSITTQGGSAFGASIWLDGKFLDSFSADSNTNTKSHEHVMDVASMESGTSHSLIVLVDNMGLESNWVAEDDTMKEPRGIMDYSLGCPDADAEETDITWSLTGNLGGEDYADRTRGPLNEGGFFAERQGYHLPSPPLRDFTEASPLDGLDKPGASFYTAKFSLDIPKSHDNPLYVVFDDSNPDVRYRALFYINGWQFGKYVNNLGPQTYFPVPEGIINHRGENWISVLVWAMDEGGCKPGISLEGAIPVLTGMEPVKMVKSPHWRPRKGAY